MLIRTSILFCLAASLMGCAHARNSYETACTVSQKHKWDSYESKDQALVAFANKVENAAPDSDAAIAATALSSMVENEPGERYKFFKNVAVQGGAEEFQCVSMEENF